jgi:N-acyl-D-aspartate/D-glutamate deacylase
LPREEHKEPFDALLDVAVADGLRTSFGPPVAQESEADWAVRREILWDKRIAVGASDAGAHLDMIDTFNYPTQLLDHAVRRHGVLTTEEAVHLITQVPAELYGLRERGVVREGSWADLVIFDEDTVGQRSFTLPLRSSGWRGQTRYGVDRHHLRDRQRPADCRGWSNL